MIARTWTAELSPENESAYLESARELVVPHLRGVPGYRGAQFLRRLESETVEVLVITYWESMDAVLLLTGGQPSTAYLPPEIAAKLERFDSSASHYTVVLDDHAA